MTTGPSVDGVLVEWGERLFYPGNRIVRSGATPHLRGSLQSRAAAVRRRIESTVSRRSVQVMVKVIGGGRGIAAIAAHFRYISKARRLDIEDDRGVLRSGKDALHDLVEQWRYGGEPIDELGHRREAFNIMLSMPSGTDPRIVLMSAREFANIELRGHRYVMVLHDHQANPHVHLSVKAASRSGERLNPRKADLHRWRETFAERLRGYGIEAEATRQATRGVLRNVDPLWRVKAREEGRLREERPGSKQGESVRLSRQGALDAWVRITEALARFRIGRGPSPGIGGSPVRRAAADGSADTGSAARGAAAPWIASAGDHAATSEARHRALIGPVRRCSYASRSIVSEYAS